MGIERESMVVAGQSVLLSSFPFCLLPLVDCGGLRLESRAAEIEAGVRGKGKGLSGKHLKKDYT